MLLQGTGQGFGPGGDALRATVRKMLVLVVGVGSAMRTEHSTECRAPGTTPSPRVTAPRAGAHSPDAEQTLLPHLFCAQVQKALRSEHPGETQLATSQEAMPGSIWSIPGSQLCAAPGTRETGP